MLFVRDSFIKKELFVLLIVIVGLYGGRVCLFVCVCVCVQLETGGSNRRRSSSKFQEFPSYDVVITTALRLG